MFSKKEPEKLEKTISDDDQPKSRARKIRMLLKKNKGLFSDKLNITDFIEPCIFLIRRSRATEFFEDASKGNFIFNHSDGRRREIYLDPAYLLSFDFGKKKFKGYIVHEDEPLPLPQNPILMVDSINGVVEKSLMDLKRFETKAESIKMKTLKMLGIFVLLLILMIFLYQSHTFEKVIGLITGHPYVEPLTANNINSENITKVLADKTIDITSQT